MTYEQFWYGEPSLCKAYRDLNKLRIEQRNQELWMQGLYIYDAVSAALSNSFSKHKVTYIKEPIRLFPKTELEEEIEKEKIRRKLVEELNRWKKAFDKNQSEKSQ